MRGQRPAGAGIDVVAPDTVLLDVEHAGRPGFIAAGLLETDAGPVLVDPGPAATLPVLRDRLAVRGHALRDVHAIVLTHIHLDHAGAAGAIVAAAPRATVYVHEFGAPHLVDPSRLLRSAARIFGDGLERMWGTPLPVPEPRVRDLRGGETLSFGRRRLRVAYTPGHAWHHVCLLDDATGTAFVGDTLGERPRGSTFVVPSAPPPDIDLVAWADSRDAVRAWRPARLVLTHFGCVDAVEPHIAAFERELECWIAEVRTAAAAAGDDAVRAARFEAAVLARIRAAAGPGFVDWYRLAGIADSWYGLARAAGLGAKD
jgi:glyoxylase-like metal-dependent hydrolase (beta-lactamase superfamily II)